MSVCYNKLWKLMIDRKMKKKDLIALSGISRSTVAKLTHDENVNTDVLARICKALQCDCAISTTGIAGPGGGTTEKPVGLVYIAAARHGLCAVRELHLRGSRRMIRERAVAQALNLLKELLESKGDSLC